MVYASLGMSDGHAHNEGYSLLARASAQRTMDVAATILSLGTNKLVARGSGWLTRNGLARYVVPALLLNEAFGAYRVYLAAGATGIW